MSAEEETEEKQIGMLKKLVDAGKQYNKQCKRSVVLEKGKYMNYCGKCLCLFTYLQK